MDSIPHLTATMRWMTHVNVGTTLGLVAWVLWLAALPTTAAQWLTLVPIEATSPALLRCAGPVPANGSGRVPGTGADL